MNHIKLIVSDLDQTLLNSQKVITDHTVSILEQCRQKGIKVVFATARSEKSCERFVAQFEPDAIVSNGGALARLKEKTVYCASLSQEISNALIKLCSRNPTIKYMTVETKDGYFVNHPIDKNDPGWVDYTHGVQFDFANDILVSDVYKLTIEISDAQLAYKIAEAFPCVDTLSFSGENWYRYAHKSATKWLAIKELATYFKIDIKDIVAFGDDYNDVEMLQNCGTGIAVCNSIDEVKAVADDICESNDEDGVAKWIYKNVLSHEV